MNAAKSCAQGRGTISRREASSRKSLRSAVAGIAISSIEPYDTASEAIFTRWQVVTDRSCSNEFRHFLDGQQYSTNSILRYEKIFGEGFVSTGGVQTTTVSLFIFFACHFTDVAAPQARKHTLRADVRMLEAATDRHKRAAAAASPRLSTSLGSNH